MEGLNHCHDDDRAVVAVVVLRIMEFNYCKSNTCMVITHFR